MEFSNTDFVKDGNTGIITVKNGRGPRGLDAATQLEVRAILEEVKADTSITLLFITGAGDRSSVFRQMVNTDLDAKKRKGFRVGPARQRKGHRRTSTRKTKARLSPSA